MINKKLNIAIVGLGNIGSYLYKYLKTNKVILSKKNNCIPNVIFVSARNRNKKRNIKINKKKWLKNYLDSTKLKNVDVIVELSDMEVELLKDMVKQKKEELDSIEKSWLWLWYKANTEQAKTNIIQLYYNNVLKNKEDNEEETK